MYFYSFTQWVLITLETHFSLMTKNMGWNGDLRHKSVLKIWNQEQKKYLDHMSKYLKL